MIESTHIGWNGGGGGNRKRAPILLEAGFRSDSKGQAGRVAVSPTWLRCGSTRLALAFLLLTACAAQAEPPKPARDPITVYNAPSPILVVCTLTPDGDKLTYARGPAFAAMSCADYGRQLQAIEQKYGAGQTFVQACALAEKCFSEEAK